MATAHLVTIATQERESATQEVSKVCSLHIQVLFDAADEF